MPYIRTDTAGNIVAMSDQKFEDSEYVEYAVACASDGKLYRAGTEPAGLSETDISFLRLRGARDMRIAATDFYLASDYPISPEALTAIKDYRQALRDLPAQPGAPWDGGGELTPWPELPAVQGV